MAETSDLGPVVSRVLGGGVFVSGVLLAAGLAASPLLGPDLIKAGIAVMVATPVVRVLVLTWALARRREWPFVWAGVAVLALLALSAMLGRVHA